MAVLEELERAIRTVAQGAGRSVVGVGARWGRGSGVVVGEGRVLTNAHNVRGSEVAVTFGGGRTEEGTVAGVDEDADLAVISVDTADAPALEAVSADWRKSAMVSARAAFLLICRCSSSASTIWLPMVCTGDSELIGSWKMIEIRPPRIDRRTGWSSG